MDHRLDLTRALTRCLWDSHCKPGTSLLNCVRSLALGRLPSSQQPSLPIPSRPSYEEDLILPRLRAVGLSRVLRHMDGSHCLW